ncbi:hypothetical protein [Aurantimonas sp. A3-2-R12]|uniref:hypothetical protein n=1 Tax=Aurantimonas sp. A3-2-R12 TaxID=3114362 RepID=UPI002E19A743|nr:hypothetical protein [Aurantimonas sp. A3-2-R12]
MGQAKSIDLRYRGLDSGEQRRGAVPLDDAERALDTMRRLLEAVSAKDVAEKISAARDTILRTKYAELARNEERRKMQRSDISVDTVAGLIPWREVVEALTGLTR